MKEFIEYLIKQIVTRPEEVQVTDTFNEVDNTYNYRVTVSQDDMGLVIGKEGRTIKSIRALTRAKAIKDGVRINLELAEPEGKTEDADL
ncbi:MAG: hypothetical protein UU77_C0010G0017 [candidate division WWE3 bacterium GW2011_GWC1_41_7]|uniref:RNA-binding protein KhpA n=4 Tax=Katanobacteria TaxID=422282 RepID=A0A0G1A6M4_UNCKA|nr:MAG: hypothetical protein UU72_C0010G0037 [candidate division WWE3 bacterium GW2011_GWB1_41_6]KKS20993.1 MAG: hypothetical protein UU77_C0010G0017 [candidate division WWE3 bacterium GW2011_GWC1_41_7]KKS21745.1 MAG: hypothetical protein UU80_C0021G0016 [candidate division WWE3 bacterium GW2011_GWA1_41_8]OGC56503.1 MAG: hypothetical protein A2976_02840 [candidate division WWE3 bacterium RIFCSPLOWO2_01_FULL_41_9]